MRLEEIIGSRVREARESLELTQEALGKKLEKYLGRAWARQAVSLAEQGGRDFNAVELLSLAMVLEHPVHWFVMPDSPGEKIELPGRQVTGTELIGMGAVEKADWAQTALARFGSELVERSTDFLRQAQELQASAVALFQLGAKGPRRKR